MEVEDFQQWLLRSEVCPETKSSFEPVSGLIQECPDNPVRVWYEFAKTQTWLHESSRAVDATSASSFAPREHEVAVPKPEGEMEKWLIQPVDCVSGQLQATLSVSNASSDMQYWLSGHQTFTKQLTAIVNSPLSIWLKKEEKRKETSLTDYSAWLYRPEGPAFTKENAVPDPLRGWKRYQEGVSWLKGSPSSSPCMDSNRRSFSSLPLSLNDDSKWLAAPKSDHVSGSLPPTINIGIDSQWLATPKDEKVGGSLPPTIDMGIDNKWLATPTTINGVGESIPKTTPGDIDQWLLSSAPSDQDSIASVATLGSEFELVDEY